MNKRYMDFVPKSSSKGAVKKTVKKPVTGLRQDDFVEVSELEVNEIFEVRDDKPRAGVTAQNAVSKSPKVEDYRKKFVNVEVSKRPLSVEDKTRSRRPLNVEDKAKAVVPKKAVSTNEKKPKPVKVMKPSFVNTERVAKRPLSKNVYQKKVAAPKEVPSGPVTIIDKPEKDSKVGLVVTIIITIILGAAAGTVAFLLLPK